jgi:hypothetical protein
MSFLHARFRCFKFVFIRFTQCSILQAIEGFHGFLVFRGVDIRHIYSIIFQVRRVLWDCVPLRKACQSFGQVLLLHPGRCCCSIRFTELPHATQGEGSAFHRGVRHLPASLYFWSLVFGGRYSEVGSFQINHVQTKDICCMRLGNGGRICDTYQFCQ